MIYTIHEVASRWKCSRDVVYDLLKTGKLKGFKVGGLWRIREDAINQYEGGNT